LRVIDRFDTLDELVPLLLDGFPMSATMAVFEAAAVAEAVAQSEAWKGLKWLVAIEDAERYAWTKGALQELATLVGHRLPEQGVANDLATRAAALLLWAAQDDALEAEGISLAPRNEWTYAHRDHYLADPGRSFFALERRHADAVLSSSDLEPVSRADRAGRLLTSPDYIPPTAFEISLRAVLGDYSGEDLHRHSSATREEHRFEIAEIALARCAPDLLATIQRRKMAGFAHRDSEARSGQRFTPSTRSSSSTTRLGQRRRPSEPGIASPTITRSRSPQCSS
jgi:hypothetical protein